MDRVRDSKDAHAGSNNGGESTIDKTFEMDQEKSRSAEKSKEPPSKKRTKDSWEESPKGAGRNTRKEASDSEDDPVSE